MCALVGQYSVRFARLHFTLSDLIPLWVDSLLSSHLLQGLPCNPFRFSSLNFACASVTLEVEPVIKLLSRKDILFKDTVPNEPDSDSAGSGQSQVVGSCRRKITLDFVKGGESELLLKSNSYCISRNFTAYYHTRKKCSDSPHKFIQCLSLPCSTLSCQVIASVPLPSACKAAHVYKQHIAD